MNARELLAAATPRPWRHATEESADSSDARIWHRILGPKGFWIVPKWSTSDGVDLDADLIVRAVNEYEALIALEDAVRDNERRLDETGYSDGDDIGLALARLDEVRGG